MRNCRGLLRSDGPFAVFDYVEDGAGGVAFTNRIAGDGARQAFEILQTADRGDQRAMGHVQVAIAALNRY